MSVEAEDGEEVIIDTRPACLLRHLSVKPLSGNEWVKKQEKQMILCVCVGAMTHVMVMDGWGHGDY